MWLFLWPYHAENTGSSPITEVKQRRAWSVLGWVGDTLEYGSRSWHQQQRDKVSLRQRKGEDVGRSLVSLMVNVYG